MATTERISVLGKGPLPSLLLGLFFFLQMQKGKFEIRGSVHKTRAGGKTLHKELGIRSTGVKVSLRVSIRCPPGRRQPFPVKENHRPGGLRGGSTYPDVHFGAIVFLSLEELRRSIGGAAAPRLQQLPGSEQVTEAKI